MINMLKVKIGKVRIDYDKNYGRNKKTGWSVFIDSACYEQTRKFLIVALFKSFWDYYKYRRNINE